MPGAQVIMFEGEKIKELRQYFDMMTLLGKSVRPSEIATAARTPVRKLPAQKTDFRSFAARPARPNGCFQHIHAGN